MPNYEEIINFGTEPQMPPTVKERIAIFIYKNKNTFFSKDDIWKELKGKLCYLQGYGICKANEKSIHPILVCFCKMGFIERFDRNYKGKSYILYHITDLGVQELKHYEKQSY